MGDKVTVSHRIFYMQELMYAVTTQPSGSYLNVKSINKLFSETNYVWLDGIVTAFNPLVVVWGSVGE